MAPTPDGTGLADYYLKSEADAAIAELKRENERLKKQSSCTFSEDCLRARRLKAENESLKAKLAEKDEEIDKQKWRGDEWAKACNQKDKEIESLKASHYAEMVDAGMRERRLQHALYKACANWAHHRVFVRYKTNEKAWENVERKCRAMEEKYK